jgi:hypothetical protein
VIQQQIWHSLQRAEAQRNKLKKNDLRYSIINLVLGALATFIAGESAISGSPALVNWRVTTAVTSLLTLSTTIVSGIHKKVVSPDLLSEASECVAKLKALRLESNIPTGKIEQICDEYQQIVSEFSNIDC